MIQSYYGLSSWFHIRFLSKNFLVWLDGIAQPKVPDHYKEEDWDWIL